MSTHARRLAALERRYPDPYHDHPARIPAWLRPWIDPLSIEELEVLTAAHEEAGGDPATLPPEIRGPYAALRRSYDRYCEEIRS